ncbi:myelin protein zero-like protein 2 isoform X1 [Lampetra planeri]
MAGTRCSCLHGASRLRLFFGSHLLLILLLYCRGEVAAMKVYVSGEVEVTNGTEARIPCTYKSSSPIGSGFFIMWTFKPAMGGATENILTYSGGKPYPTGSRFMSRLTLWGNAESGDATISLRDTKFTDNGTFTCNVQNPPDVGGQAGHTELRVVLSMRAGTLSEGKLVGMVIGGLAGVVMLTVIIAAIAMVCKKYRRGGYRDKAATTRSPQDTLLTEKPFRHDEERDLHPPTPPNGQRVVYASLENLPPGKHPSAPPSVEYATVKPLAASVA